MKVTFVLEPADLSGGVRVVAEYARRLVARGHEVTVVSTPNPDLPFRLKLSHLRHKGEWFTPLALGPSHLDEAAQVGVKRVVLEKYRPVTTADVPEADAVVATTWKTGHWVAALPAKKGAKFHFMQHYETWAGWDAEDGCPAAWRLPTRKIVISRWLEKLCREEFGQEAVHIPNSVDTERFSAPPRGKQSQPTVGFLYSATGFKGVEVVLEAIEQLGRQFPGLRVVSFGREDVSTERPLPAGSHYEKQPAQDRLRELYAMCDVWMCGSHAEGFHLPPLEAMACRCPVVSTRVGGPEDVIEEGVNGHLVEVRDAAGLAEKASRVLSLSDDAWREMSDAAYRTAHAYSWEDATDLFERALKKEDVRNESSSYERAGAA